MADPRITINRPASEAQPRDVWWGLLPMRREPDEASEQVNELRYGENFTLYEERDGWAYGQSGRDGYVGYVHAEGLGQIEGRPTHRVKNLTSLVFPEATVKKSPVDRLTFFSPLIVVEEGERFLKLASGGYVHKRHAMKIGEWAEADPVFIAGKFLGTPYLWGGVSPLGCDCSGLVQIALEATGQPAPRDSDMQMAVLGENVPPGEKKQRGDLIFFKGHVGIMTDEATLLHANAFHGRVVSEPLADVVLRGDAVVGHKRV
jgi:cell wall-associated NlpC family hydrolase